MLSSRRGRAARGLPRRPPDRGRVEDLMARQAPEQGLFYPGAEAAAEAERRVGLAEPGCGRSS